VVFVAISGMAAAKVKITGKRRSEEEQGRQEAIAREEEANAREAQARADDVLRAQVQKEVKVCSLCMVIFCVSLAFFDKNIHP
jgi:hypothetical protein